MTKNQVKQLLKGNAIVFLDKNDTGDKMLVIVPVQYNGQQSNYVKVYQGYTQDNFFGYDLIESGNVHESHINTLKDINNYFNYLGVF